MSNSTTRHGEKRRGGGHLRRISVLLMAALFTSSNFSGLVQAAAGDLDPTFGAGGRVTTSIGGIQDQANDVAVQADGKIIAAGSALVFGAMRGDDEFALARYNGDGSLDPTFGAGGKVITDFFGFSDRANALAIQNDGKIVVAGLATGGSDISTIVFALARYNPDGSLDPTFGSAGKVTTDFPGVEDIAQDVAIQANGKIIAAGYVNNTGTLADFAMARYNVDGSLDTTFGSGGKVTTDFSGGFDKAYAVAIQSNGKIIAAGDSLNPTTFYDYALARYDTTGNLDSTFGTGGKVTTSISTSGETDSISAIAIQSDGKIIASGYSLSGIGNYDFVLTRYNADGSLDSGFGSGGIVVTDFFGFNDHAFDASIQFNGKIVVVGEALTASSRSFGLVRYNTDGSLDPTFGTGGKVTTNFPGGNGAIANAVAILANGNIVAAGYRQPLSSSLEEFAVARYFGDAPPCSITCPSSIVSSNTPGLCGAVVTYTPPSGPSCGPIACSPPSGSFFPQGSTTVICEPAAGPACSFTVTVADTQPPSITCPANVTAVTPAGSASAVVNFDAPTATDNCASVTTTCTPPAGSSFSVGVTTVTCTARDATGNSASCAFTVTVFDVCLQDDSNPQVSLVFNSHTGDYRFCGVGVTSTGRGVVTRRGDIVTLEHNAADRRLIGRKSGGLGTASLQSPPGSLAGSITDRDIRNNTCNCR